MDSTNKLNVSIWCCHMINFHSMGMRFELRDVEMIKILRYLKIEYRLLLLDINIWNPLAPSFQSSFLKDAFDMDF